MSWFTDVCFPNLSPKKFGKFAVSMYSGWNFSYLLFCWASWNLSSTPGWTQALFNKLKLKPFLIDSLVQQNSFYQQILDTSPVNKRACYFFCHNQQCYTSLMDNFIFFIWQCLWLVPWFQVVYETSMRAKYRGRWPMLPTTTQTDTALRTTWTLFSDWAMRYVWQSLELYKMWVYHPNKAKVYERPTKLLWWIMQFLKEWSLEDL